MNIYIFTFTVDHPDWPEIYTEEVESRDGRGIHEKFRQQLRVNSLVWEYPITITNIRKREIY